MVERWNGHLLVLGLGTSGEAAASWALEQAEAGAPVRVTVVDSGSGDILERRAGTLRARGAEVILGTNEEPEADLVIASPGIPPASPLMVAVSALGVPVISEIELAYRISVAPWIAVTGTNGKTTTTGLIVHLLREAGFVAEPAGNFGPPAVRVATETGRAGIIVAEVSSFQLARIERFHPRVAVLLNITPDHLDYHGTMEAYAADKARIFANQVPGDTAVIDVDDPGSAALAPVVGERGVNVLRVSRTAPQAPGAFVSNGSIVADIGHGPVEVLPVRELSLRGEHNVSNALAAVAAALAMGASPTAVARGLRTFAPIEHRLEPAGVAGGVEYFNDSKATNPDAVIKALTAFDGREIVLLLGGRNKGVDLRPLAAAAAERCASVIVFGEAAPEFAAAFTAIGAPATATVTLADAVAEAARIASAGDVVLLSPGCTSFDEFGNYHERGRRFKELVASPSGVTG